MVGLKGTEPPISGLRKPWSLLNRLVSFRLYYIPQQVTNSTVLARVLDLTRFEHRPTTVLLQSLAGGRA